MMLTPGTTIGGYEIVSSLGSGGMGEVYRARDPRLKRDVAVKVLPSQFTSDPDRLARFQREAEVLATLNHPNIAQVHGLEENGGVRALVMELVEGEDLAHRLARGPIPLDEALPIARQIAEALVAAHDHAIVHRDLKPANVRVRPDGTVKVLDFGLAKAGAIGGAAATSAAGAHAFDSPTITSPALTLHGMLLGTAAYMSPEQARGRPADKRSDLWAFGCVVYEMLTGTRAFPGADVSETLANVLTTGPVWTRLPIGTPASIVRLLQRCLARDRKRRLADAADALLELDAATDDPGLPLSTSAVTRASGPLWRERVLWSAAVLGAIAVATLIPLRQPATVSPKAIRFMVPTARLPFGSPFRDLAMFPDGSRVAYVSGGETRTIVVRPLAGLDALPVPGTEGAAAPFVSADGRWLGYFDSASRELRRVPVEGGTPVRIARITGLPAGAVWTPDDQVIFATTDPATGLMAVAATGGEPRLLTTPETAAGELDHTHPSLLPDGRTVLFTAFRGSLTATEVHAIEMSTGTRRRVLANARQASFVDGGFLVYFQQDGLRWQRFDADRMTFQGEPSELVPAVHVKQTGTVSFSAAADGTLAYVPRVQSVTVPRSLVWVDRRGREEPVGAPVRTYGYARISPSGSRVAVQVRDDGEDLWVWDAGRFNRLTNTPDILDTSPLWMPDERRIVYGSGSITTAIGAVNLFVLPRDGSGTALRLSDVPYSQVPTAVSRDGSRLLFHESPQGSTDIAVATLAGTFTTTRLLATPAAELNAVFSPDDRWIAYESTETGSAEIFVRPFPNVAERRIQISTDGGTRPLWAPNGRELFFLSGGGTPTGDGTGATLMSVAVTPGPEFGVGPPRPVSDQRYFGGGAGVVGRTYDISPDGSRLLVIKDEPGQQTSAIVVFSGWRPAR
jgi:serine/threonine protein kinase